MNPDEVEEQIREMFNSVPIDLLNTIEGFIIILHGSARAQLVRVELIELIK